MNEGSTAKTVLKDTPAKFKASLLQNMPQVGGSLKNCKIACIANPATPGGITIKSLGFDHLVRFGRFAKPQSKIGI